MKYKGLNKIYFGIGLRDDYRTFVHKEFYFYLFKLIQKNPEGEILKRGRDYKGFNLVFRFRLPNFGINY
jgi:hypothetical protein